VHVPLATFDQLRGADWREEAGAGERLSAAAEVAGDQSWREVIPALGFGLDGDPSAEGDGTGAADGDAAEGARGALARLAVDLQGGGRVVSPERRPLDRARIERLLAAAADHAHPDYLLTPEELEQIRQGIAADPQLGDEALARFDSSPEFREKILRAYLAVRRRRPAAGPSPEVVALVDSWVAGRPRGWEQIDALVQGLRGHARLDPDATVPSGESDPVGYFLLKSRRGPDYLFASSAAVLLRRLNYPSRLAGGFYVRPDDYRLLSGTTPVRARDVHYWTQVQTANGVWVNLEPTPGYEPARPAPSAGEQAARLAGTAWDITRRCWPALLAVGAVAAAGFVFRRRLAERLATLWWRLRAAQPPDRLVPATWRLLDRRARAAGVGRRPGTTLTAWSAAVGAAAPALGRHLAELAEVADRLTHAPRSARPPGRPEEVRALCRGAVRAGTVAALRQACPPGRPSPGGGRWPA
jgi:transglutaminase-like putative cysteine protease